ncbi:large conductance mechanosensitive channel protein MscL [Microbacterium marinilacus]|uniref:Large-conductance mechanosensitive channel n=1 Tax=Microbacterium marinilacus TaxID=415209 RepID=A0ABP7BE80_9MICO|nr:large conductance mechanosensitive channel protein MscL [Microbacterium marinilacus]MBY0688904.1 large conductance mechanosensitive channel protein MscL [Microbacterium marinilacus]
MADNKGLIEGFKEFISRGNVIDLAVAVVIGTAFTAIVTAIVESVINPLIGAFVPSGNLAAWTIDFPGIFAEVKLGIGGIISALINFFAVALVVYLALVRPFAVLKARRDAKLGVNQADDAPPAPTQEELLAEIRDLLAAQNRP